MSSRLLISVVVPTFNQELGINEFYRRTKNVLLSLQETFSYEIIFVNDSSTDNTFLALCELSKNDLNVKIINFSRNFGNQMAITAGINYAKGDLAIIIDDDLQDPPELIPAFISKWQEGYQVVFGLRPRRKGINPLFNFISKIHYRLINRLSDIKIPLDTGDFRLIDRIVIDSLRNLQEENRYYRGLVAWVGFRQIGIEYQRDIRFAGKSNFSIFKYFNFAINGLTSFSEKPLHISSILGFIITLVSFIFLVTLLFMRLFSSDFSIPGWPSIIAIILFFGGIQLLSIGIVSIYIGKIFREVKKRPLYIVSEAINFD